MKKSLLIWGIVVTLCVPTFVLATAVNEEIEEVDLATWVEDTKLDTDNTETLDSVVDIPGPGVRYKASTTVGSGWFNIGISDDYPVAHIYGFPWNSSHPGFADWSGYTEYELHFRNNNATGYVYVTVYYTTMTSGNWHESSGGWLAPGETAVRSVSLAA